MQIMAPKRTPGSGSSTPAGSLAYVCTAPIFSTPAGSNASHTPIGTSPYANPTGRKLKNVARFAIAEYALIAIVAASSTTSDSKFK